MDTNLQSKGVAFFSFDSAEEARKKLESLLKQQNLLPNIPGESSAVAKPGEEASSRPPLERNRRKEARAALVMGTGYSLNASNVLSKQPVNAALDQTDSMAFLLKDITAFRACAARA